MTGGHLGAPVLGVHPAAELDERGDGGQVAGGRGRVQGGEQVLVPGIHLGEKLRRAQVVRAGEVRSHEVRAGW